MDARQAQETLGNAFLSVGGDYRWWETRCYQIVKWGFALKSHYLLSQSNLRAGAAPGTVRAWNLNRSAVEHKACAAVFVRVFDTYLVLVLV